MRSLICPLQVLRNKRNHTSEGAARISTYVQKYCIVFPIHIIYFFRPIVNDFLSHFICIFILQKVQVDCLTASVPSVFDAASSIFSVIGRSLTCPFIELPYEMAVVCISALFRYLRNRERCVFKQPFCFFDP